MWPEVKNRAEGSFVKIMLLSVTLAHDKGQLQVSSQLWVMLYLPFIMVFSHEWL